MTYEEKLIRYILSKLIQKKYLALKHELPSEKKLGVLINITLEKVKDKYKQFSLVRKNSKTGLLTPLLLEFVDDLRV